MNTQLVNFEAPELIAVEPSKAKQIKETFLPMAEMLETFEERFNEIISESKNGITQDLSLKAKRLRLDVAQVRIETGKLKDKQKEKIKIEDKAIMAIHNILVWAVSEKEDKLKAIEKDAEIKKQKRLEALQFERVKIMLPYIEDAENRNFSEMEEDVFQAYFTTKKQAHLDLIEAEKKAEADRIAKEKKEAEERKRIEAENAKLKAEREASEKKAEAERKERNKLEAERLAKEAKAESERKEKEAEAEKERLRLQNIANAKHEAELKIERDKAAKLEAENLATQKALEDAEKAKEASLQAELNKGDAEKVKDLISDLTALKTKYTFKSKTNQKMFVSVCGLIDKVLTYISK
jgi:hypothetical protein